MTYLSSALPVILIGILAVTIIDVIGSISSRKLNFPYAYLTPFSLLVYTLIGYFVAKEANQNWAILSACIVGLFDATAGWKLSMILKANFGRFKEQTEKLTLYSRIVTMIGLGIVFGFIGYLFANN